MDYAERLENVTVLGAAGKMGSGIVLLTAMEMADLALKSENKGRNFVLNAVDVSHQALSGLTGFLRTEVLKAAEKKAVRLRKVYENRAELVENEEIIHQYVFDVLKIVRPATALEAAYESGLIFEAVIENVELKAKLLSQIDQNSKKSPWFFTNTSSIPIHELNAGAGLGGRILGVHFYNPPAVQKLVELIEPEGAHTELVEFVTAFAKNLKKTVVRSADVAGFIGNGHFMRDALHGISGAERLAQSIPLVQAIYMINKVGQEYLVRPMGIFQLMDYVGLDVCQSIMKVMTSYSKGEVFHSELLDRLIQSGVKGGQFADGSQKDGWLKYERGRPAGILDPASQNYIPLAEIQSACAERLGPMPRSIKPWKSIVGNPNREGLLRNYFTELNRMETLGADLARRCGKRSMEIAQKLVADKVARCEEDVNTVLLTGFYHAYGPINGYFQEAR